MLTIAGAWMRRWIHFCVWRATLLRCIGLETDMLTSVWQRRKVTSVVCIAYCIVFTVKLTKVTSHNRLFTRVWTLFFLIVFFLTTGLWIVWIISVLFWTSSIALVNVRMTPTVFTGWNCAESFSSSPHSSPALYVVSICPKWWGAWYAPVASGSYFPSLLSWFGMKLWALPSSTHFLRGSVWIRGMCSRPNFTGCFFWCYPAIFYWWLRSPREATFSCIATGFS